jgi:imidazolonepropionase
MDLLIKNIGALYTLHPDEENIESKDNYALGFFDGKLVYQGPSTSELSGEIEIDGSEYIALPGLVDPHTHTVFAGSRSTEFARRLAGENYSTILEQGGGIHSTVKYTREASVHELRHIALQRIEILKQHGVTTVEIKSGYGLTPTSERNMLLAIADPLPIRVHRTFLVHTIDTAFKSNRNAYIEQVLTEQLPLCAPLADSIDIYCDRGAFTLEESKLILKTAQEKYGLQIKAHSEQVEYTGIAKWVAENNGISVDHLEQLRVNDIDALANSNCVATFLPGAQLYLKDPAPPIQVLREAGVAIAIGTDFNPGTSPVSNIWTAATLSTLLSGLTMEEALLGITRNAGKALGRDDLGWIGEGSVNDVIFIKPPAGEPLHFHSLIQYLASHRIEKSVVNGKLDICH